MWDFRFGGTQRRLLSRRFFERMISVKKIIVPFATSGGSGLGKTAETLREIVPMAIVMEGKLLNGKQKAEELKKWADSFEK